MRTTKTRPTRNVSSPKMAKHSPMNEKDLFLAHSRQSMAAYISKYLIE